MTAKNGPDEQAYHRKFNILWWCFLDNSAWEASGGAIVGGSGDEVNVEGIHKDEFERK